MANNRYAILFSGTGDPWTLNDLEFCWRLLIDTYQFKPNDIQVLYFSKKLETNDPDRPATSYPGPRPNDQYRLPRHGQGTAAEFGNACQVLSQKLQPQDLVFIYTAGHGSEDTAQKPYLLTFDDSEFDAQMFCGHVELLPQHASLLIMMQQCYGAGFMSPIINAKDSKRIHADRVSFACASDGLSYADDDQMFSRFSWGWIAAHLDKDNEGKQLAVPVTKDNSGFIEASEAYRYARKVGAPPAPDQTRTRNRPGDAKDIRLTQI